MWITNRISALVWALGLTAFSLTAMAHHHRVNFAETNIAVFGEITQVNWSNPHVYIFMRAQDESGADVDWEIETGSTPVLTRRGLTRDALRPGDLVTVRGSPDRNPDRKLMLLDSVTKSDGTTLAMRGPVADPNDIVQARTTSIQGVWSAVGSPYDRTKAATHLPLTDKGRAAAAQFDVANDPFADCIPPPVPDSLSTPYLHEIVIDEDRVILREEYWEIERIVYMDGRDHPESGPRTNQGHSIGRWEGNVLVVDTRLFADHAFGNGSGIPSGAQKHIVERYSLSDDGTMVAIDYVLEDPEFLSAPVTDTRHWRYTPHLELLPNECDLETARRYTLSQ